MSWLEGARRAGGEECGVLLEDISSLQGVAGVRQAVWSLLKEYTQYTHWDTAVQVQYTLFIVQSTMYLVQFTVYSEQCTVSCVQLTVYSVLYSIQYKVWLSFTVYSVQWTCTVDLYSVQCTVYSVQCTVYSVQCTV